MFFVVSQTWPLSSNEEIGRVSVEMLIDPWPDYMERVILLLSPGGEGAKSIAVYKVEDGKDAEAYQKMVERFLKFSVVPGYKITIEPYLTVKQGLSIVGLY